MHLPTQTIQDRYEVLEEIAKGGMAQVYKARQLSLSRLVAIKEIKSVFAGNPELVERFKREARISATLIHENIVQVYNFGEPPGGPLFIVMEFVDGRDLRTILSRMGSVPPRLAAMIGREVARALAYAHALGLIHRDVKPANVMISRSGEVKLMDFGIVREMDSELTRTGAFLGTPSYMSPEQLLGEDLSPASDLFSLGLVLYEIMAGQKPFKADSEASLSKKIRAEKEARLRSHNSEVSWRLSGIVHQCLKKDPRKRPGSAEEVARRLEKVVSSRSREEDKRELAGWLRSELGEDQATGELQVSAVSIAKPAEVKSALVIKSGAPEAAAPVKARVVREEAAGPGLAPPFEAAVKVKASAEPPRPESAVKPATRSPIPRLAVPEEAAEERAARERSEEFSDPEESEEPGPTIAEWTLKWLWRLILVAIIVTAAIIAFFLIGSGTHSNLPFDGSLLENLLEKLGSKH